MYIYLILRVGNIPVLVIIYDILYLVISNFASKTDTVLFMLVAKKLWQMQYDHVTKLANELAVSIEGGKL